MGRKYFGTDGVRGVVPGELTPEFALRLGRAAAEHFSAEGRSVVLGTDTRLSSDTIKAALVAGLAASGVTVLDAGILPTPGISFLTAEAGAAAGVVVSASHNPFEYNGIKFFDAHGYKLSDEAELRIEEIFERGSFENAREDRVGRWLPLADAAERYARFIAERVGRVEGIGRIAIDCANGATCAAAMLLFGTHLALDAEFINAEPNGLNINARCGATDTGKLREVVRAGGYEGGIAFDGDGDRVIFVDEHGEELNGDHLIGFLARQMKLAGRLPNDAVVATVMSNMGLETYLRDLGVRLFRSAVGDRYVLEKMLEEGAVLGGEQSGHIILLEETRTGDGLLVAAHVLKALSDVRRESGRTARFSELRQFDMWPQVQVQVETDRKDEVSSNERVRRFVDEAAARLGESGRVLVRPSGTEPKVRVMVEARDAVIAETVARELAQMIERELA